MNGRMKPKVVAEAKQEPHPAGGARYGGIRQFIRMCSFAAYFLGCCTVIHITQLVGSVLYLFSKPVYYAYMARTKQHFGILVTTITQWWSPTVVRVTGDKSVRHQLKRTPDGRLECEFPERIILIANHQLYSDWLYLWWISYTARLHGFIYIILKESLKYIPVIGGGMQFYGFIFLARKWEQDKPRFKYRLDKLAAGANQEPMWLMIFPEGTNLSDNGRNASAKYAKKIGIKDLRHLMIPRSTGLRFCLENLAGSVDWVYDCTVAYEGIPRDKFGQDFFTLSSTYFQGRPPKSVNMHFRRFPIASIPISDPDKFENWIRQRWLEKDDLLEYYVQNGRFPEDDDQTNEQPTIGKTKTGVNQRIKVGGKERTISTTGGSSATGNWGGPIETEVKLKAWWEALDIFVVLLTVALLANVATKAYAVIRVVTSGSGVQTF